MTEPAALPDAVTALIASVASTTEERMEDLLPVAATIAAKAHANEESLLQAERELDAILNGSEPTHLIGKALGDRGIYLGRYTPVDREGNSLCKTFNVFAAPENLTNAAGNETVFGYFDAVKRIARLENWHGHDGANYRSDEELYQALQDGSYNGGWIIPTRDLLSGKNVDGEETTPDNLYAHRGKGVLRGSFPTTTTATWALPAYYWSSTVSRDNQSNAYTLRFPDRYPGGSESTEFKDNLYHLQCRPVRLVEVTP